MRYILFINVGETFNPPANMQELTEAWVEEMDGRGVRITGSQLRMAQDATTVRVREGQTLVTDGPFVETKEQICGFDIIEASDLDEALEVATKHPMAAAGSVEIRPFWV